jgi:hypothetical protein
VKFQFTFSTQENNKIVTAKSNKKVERKLEGEVGEGEDVVRCCRFVGDFQHCRKAEQFATGVICNYIELQLTSSWAFSISISSQ